MRERGVNGFLRLAIQAITDFVTGCVAYIGVCTERIPHALARNSSERAAFLDTAHRVLELLERDIERAFPSPVLLCVLIAAWRSAAAIAVFEQVRH